MGCVRRKNGLNVTKKVTSLQNEDSLRLVEISYKHMVPCVLMALFSNAGTEEKRFVPKKLLTPGPQNFQDPGRNGTFCPPDVENE